MKFAGQKPADNPSCALDDFRRTVLSPPPETENRCQTQTAVKCVFAKNSTTVLRFLVFPRHNFWAPLEPLLWQHRYEPAAIHVWLLWAFHLSSISRRSESSLCLSKLLSLFNLDCLSGSSRQRSLHARAGLHQMWDFFWWEERSEWRQIVQFSACSALRDNQSKKLATSGFISFCCDM